MTSNPNQHELPVMAPPSACEDGAPFAFPVSGASMEPEFNEGEIVIVEPDGLIRDGTYVLANGEFGLILRQIRRSANPEQWTLVPCNPAFPSVDLQDLSGVLGVVIQKSIPGKRKLTKRYV